MIKKYDFARIRYLVQPHIPDLCARWLPDGKQVGNEWVARNPKRSDLHPGSFSINLRTGQWSDFATGDRGADIISLAAYLHHDGSETPQYDAARGLERCLGL